MLTGKQRRHLRALGHHLSPVVHVGKEGVTPPVVAALDAALASHELVKVRVGEAFKEERHEIAGELARAAGAQLVQVLGSTVLCYRPHPEEPKIVLPA